MNLVFAVKLNNRGVYCTIKMMFRLSTFQIQQFKLLQHFKKATFLLKSMVKLSKNCKIC